MKQIACYSFFTFLLMCGAAQAGLVAAQLDATNLGQRAGGIDAIGGRSDWMLSNGTLCATVSDVKHETGLSASGGWLVDLGYCGRDDDQLLYTHLVPAMERELIVPAVRIDAESDEQSASLVVYRSNESLEVVVRYTLNLAAPEQLQIDTTLRRIGPGVDIPMLGQIWLHPSRSLTPYTLSTRDRAYSAGFNYPAFDSDDVTAALGAMMPADLSVLVGSDVVGPAISYGIQSLDAVLEDEEGEQHPLIQLTLVETDYSNQLWLSRPLWFGDGAGRPGRLEMLQTLFMDIDEGELLRTQQRVLVSQRADVASITDRIYQGQWLRGSIDTAEATLEVYDRAGQPISHVRPDADGNFQLRLPRDLDQCQLVLRTPWGEEREIEVELSGVDQQLHALKTDAPASLRLPDNATMRLVFVGLGDTPNPQFNSDLSGFHRGGKAVSASAQNNSQILLGDKSDPRWIQLAPGTYRVYGTRGPEYSVTSQDIELLAGQQRVLEIPAPQKVLDAGPWASVDFHVHSGYSFDSAITAEQRLRSFVAQDAAVLVATEHDAVVDMAAVSRRLGFDQRLSIIGGVELTGMARTDVAPRTIGHLNVFPLQADTEAFAGGLPLHEGKRLSTVLDELQADYPAALVQLNHPRDVDAIDADLAFFQHLSIGEVYNPALPLDNIQNRSLLQRSTIDGLRDIDFDILELANGGNLELYQSVRADWLALILQGEYRPAVASSDSHHLRRPVAMPRSYVSYPAGLQHPVDEALLLDAVSRGRLFGSSGPLPSIVLENSAGEQAGIGDILSGSELLLRVSARAAPWVDVNQVWIYVNGVVAKGVAISAGEELSLPLKISGDSFITVEFYGEAGAAYAAIAPGHTPMAFTNPVWIDADGDGRWSAPGLKSIPMAISEPHSLPNPLP